jgi:peroxiredoxin family protein
MSNGSKLSMVVCSGDLDKVMAALIIANGAAAGGMEVMMFFTFWGLKAIQTGKLTGKSVFGRMLGIMNRGGVDAIGPSRLNMGGLGRWMFKKMMKSKNVASLNEMLDIAIELGVKLVPCDMSMTVMEIGRDKLIPQAAAPVGVATFLEEARNSKITLFI